MRKEGVGISEEGAIRLLAAGGGTATPVDGRVESVHDCERKGRLALLRQWMEE